MENENKELVETKEMKIEEIQSKMNEMLNMGEIENLIKSNEVEIEVDGVKYRVRKPTFAQKRATYDQKVKKFTELIQNSNFILEADLKATYLKRGVDIDAMQTQMAEKTAIRDSLMFQLGKAIKDQASDMDLKGFKEQINAINSEIQTISIKKTQLLEYSIENQVMITTYSYLTFLTAEKKDGDNWVPVWNKYEEFLNDSKNLANRFSYYVAMLTGPDEI
jgi:hypothetical protein